MDEQSRQQEEKARENHTQGALWMYLPNRVVTIAMALQTSPSNSVVDSSH